MRNLVLILIFTISCYTNIFAQSNDRGEQLWWTGAHTAIGFGVNTDIFGITTTSYTIGLAPMLGFELLPGLSAGPRASILYNHLRQSVSRGDLLRKFNFVDYGLGIFARGEVYRGYFIQAELMYESLDDVNPFTAEQNRINGMNAYIGVGFNQGGRTPSTEIMIAYDLNLLRAFRNNNPIGGRFGFTIFY
ncbi:MAG: hypothetical protein AAFY48_18085 [Bacteroidota bacterium]